VTEFLPEFYRMARAAGRDPAELPVTIWAQVSITLEGLQRLRDKGVARVVLHLKPEGADGVLPVLDRFATMIAKIA
jgi:hypothetical protein